MERELKNIIFDFGGVLVDLDRQAVFDAFQKLGAQQIERWNKFNQDPFVALENGTCTEAEFYQQLRELADLRPEISDEALANAWNSMLVRIPKRRLEALLRLRQRYRIFLLSNTNSIHWDYSAQHLFSIMGLTAQDYFDHIYLSYELHLQKPDAAIFQCVLDREGLKPSETIFIDDLEANCATARDLGMHTFTPSEADDWMPLFL